MVERECGRDMVMTGAAGESFETGDQRKLEKWEVKVEIKDKKRSVNYLHQQGLLTLCFWVPNLVLARVLDLAFILLLVSLSELWDILNCIGLFELSCRPLSLFNACLFGIKKKKKIDKKREIRIFLFLVWVDVFILHASLILKCKQAVYNLPRV